MIDDWLMIITIALIFYVIITTNSRTMTINDTIPTVGFTYLLFRQDREVHRNGLPTQ